MQLTHLIRFIFSERWITFAFVIILSMVGGFIYKLINRFLKHRTIMKHGYPPKKQKKEDE